MNPKQKAEWSTRRANIRLQIMTILRKIESGEVTEEEFAKLWNFCGTMLMLLSKVSPGTLEAAKKEAEIAAWINNAVEDYEVIMDNNLLESYK